jgi:uncharacterized protein (UPF0262 family)
MPGRSHYASIGGAAPEALVAEIGSSDSERIKSILLEEQARIRLSPQVEHERKAALFDLIDENHFALRGEFEGPYILHLGVEGERLSFQVCNEEDQPLARFVLPLRIFHNVIKDYFWVCDNYFKSIKTASPSRIEAIDMGRRALHNEGAELLRSRLANKVDIDTGTARRLFTLVCVLHIRR